MRSPAIVRSHIARGLLLAAVACLGLVARPALGSVIAGNLITFAVCLPLALGPDTPSGSARDWLIIAYLGVFQIALAYVWMTRGVRSLPAFEVSLLLLLEPVLNPIWTWLVHGERPGSASLAGCAVILAATAARTLRTRVG